MLYFACMKNKFNECGLTVTDAKLDMFEEYYGLLTVYNDKFNITAIKGREDVYKKNFIDSVLFADKIKGKTLIDIGSGGGFPAIPLKIMMPELSVTMIEATGKKCEFLQAVVDRLGLKNVTVLNGRAEDYAKKEGYRENFDVCTARAVARLNVLAEYCLPFVKIGGEFTAYKAKAEEELKEALPAIKTLGGCVKEVVNRKLFEFDRTAIIIEKVFKTDGKYPRANGKIKAKPL